MGYSEYSQGYSEYSQWYSLGCSLTGRHVGQRELQRLRRHRVHDFAVERHDREAVGRNCEAHDADAHLCEYSEYPTRNRESEIDAHVDCVGSVRQSGDSEELDIGCAKSEPRTP